MSRKIIISGIEITPEKIICKHCGVFDEPEYTLLESNNAMQMRCKECGTFAGNHKYATAETMTMPFGKHKGVRVADCPESYLEWLATRDIKGNLREAVDAALYRAVSW